MLTAEQLKARKNHIGGSDIAAVLGRSPWKTREDVYWDKVLDTAPGETTDSMDMGNWFENPLIDYACQRLGVECERNVTRISDGIDGGIMAAQIDGLVNGDKRIGIEAKYTGIADGWGEDGTDMIPEYYLLQAQGEMHVHKLNAIYFPVFYAAGYRPERRLYCVPRSQEIIDVVVSESVRFWKEHVEPRRPPSTEPPPMQMLRRLIREPDSVRTLSEEEAVAAMQAFEVRQQASIAKNDAEAAYERATAACLRYLVDCEAARFPDGSELRYLTENAGTFLEGENLKRLKLEMPEVYAKYTTSRTRRMLRLKAAPKAKK